MGADSRAFAESVAQLGQWYGEGKLRPHVSATFPLERAKEALKLLASRKAIGKLVLSVTG